MDTRASRWDTTWWKKVGETEWKLGDHGVRSKSSIFRCETTGEERLAGDLPCGALYALDRDSSSDRNAFPPAGHDGLAIACVFVYNGWRHHWYVDYRASNCDRKGDRDHRCWVRHGTYGEKLTVDKNGPTCGAGGGSFFMGPSNEWHGFLRDGVIAP